MPPQAPTSEPTAPAAAATPSSDAQSSQETRTGGWGGFVDRLFGSGETRTKPSGSDDTPASENDQPSGDEGAARGGDADPRGEGKPKAPPKAGGDKGGASGASDDWKPAASREEEQRRIQAEADRRESQRRRDEEKQARERATGAQRARLEQIEVELDQALAENTAEGTERARELRQERRQILAQASQGQFVSGLIGSFDQHMLVPLLAPLPQVEQEAIVEEIQAMEPLPGRKHAVEQTLKRLEKTWRADEAAKTRQRLRTDEAFLRELRAQWRDEEDEPDHVPGSPSRNGSGDVASKANAALAQLIRSRG